MTTLSFDPKRRDGLSVDLQKLLSYKLAVQGNSGSGKSWLLRTLIEGTHGAVQHLIVDPEGEFRTLREVFDDYVILAATGGDLEVTPENAARPVRELVKAGASLVLDLSEYGESDRDAVCAAAIGAVMSLEREQWRYLLVIVDEAQTLAPEGGRSAAALGSLTDLAMRGRKRGFGLVVATQRLALLNKSLLAMCSNRLVGLTTLGNDVKRAAEELGFDTSERQNLKKLAPGQWFAVGPALSQEVTLVQSAPVQSTHPEPGQLTPPTPPASEALASVIASLREQRDPSADEAASERSRVVGVSEREAQRRLEAAVAEATAPLKERIAELEAFVRRVVDEAVGVLGDGPTAPPKQVGVAVPAAPSQATSSPAETPEEGERREASSMMVPGPQLRILKALAETEQLGVFALERATAAVLSKQSPRSSAYAAHVAALNAAGLIGYPKEGLLALTEAGRDLAPVSNQPMTLAELHGRWKSYLKPYEVALLEPLLGRYPEALSREALAAASGRSLTSSAFADAVASLKNLGLVEYPAKGLVKATGLLFPSALLVTS